MAELAWPRAMLVSLIANSASCLAELNITGWSLAASRVLAAQGKLVGKSLC